MIKVASVDRLVRDSCGRGGDKTLLISAEDGTRLSFRQLDGVVSQAANVLRALGVQKRDTVSLFLRNGPAFFPPWLGAIRLGAVANPINLGLEKNIERIAYMLGKARAKIFVTERCFSETARGVRTQVKDLRVIVVDDPSLSDIDWAKKVREAGDSFPIVEVSPHDPFQMIFTSGTTGLPKAVVQHHEMLTDSFALTQDHFRYRAEDTIMCVLPLFHVNAQYTSFFPALGLGATLVLFEKFSASRFFPTIQKYGVNHVSVVPSLLTRLLAHGIPQDRNSYASFRYIVCGAAPLTVEIQKQFMQESGVAVPNGWGMTETGCWGCHSDPASIVLGSMGKALAINEMKIVDPKSGRDLPPDSVGTLLIRGINVFREYFDAPEANAEAFRLGGGWFDTGDDVRRDGRGNFFFVGRGSVDTGKVDGEFVNYLSIDEKLWEHPKVQEVCCVGVPDAIRGMVVAACVVPKPGSGLVADEVVAFGRSRGLAPYELPRHVLMVETIPKGDTGKIQRKVMTERAVELLQGGHS